MKKLLLVLTIILVLVSLVACGAKPEPETVIEEPETTTNESEKIEEKVKLSNDEMYDEMIDDYEDALEMYDLDNLDTEKEIIDKYELVNTNLLMHISRYSSDGIELSFDYKDIDKNGIDELLVGASGSIGAIYTYDESKNEPVIIFFQSTLERGSLSAHDNGIIMSEGSGGAALHYYEFGRIASDGISYEMLESIEEEYMMESETPVYRNAKTGEELSYTSLDEIMSKYIPE